MTEEREQVKAFERVWQRPSGFGSWFMVVNNQPLGQRFMITAFIFFLLGGILALLMRVQLTVSHNTFLGPEVYNQFFTMHGSTMLYLFVVPFLEGLALYVIPLLIGSRDVAFPRLTSFAWWTYLFGGLVFYATFVAGMVPEVGWFAYTPLSGPDFSGKGVDFMLLGLALVEISGIVAGIEIIVTILKLRAPGMSLTRLPLFGWAILITGVMVVFAFTVLLVATLLLELDRSVGTRFFHPDFGGSSLLWQHLFWFFGHPEVYIGFIPATGIVSMIVPVFSRRPISGYILITVALVVTGFVSFGLWVHHMFATGLPELSLTFFTAASLMIGIASGIQIFAWLATMWGTRPLLTTPLLFVLGFIFIFTLGGITGIMIAVIPFDLQVHDTFFIVAHFHYVFIGGVVFPIFAGLYYWIPKITGRLLDDSIGKWSFWLMFLGFNLTFFPMHHMGFFGLTRRVYTYHADLGIDGYNIAATVGAFIMGLAVLLSLINFFWSMRRGAVSGDNPWNGETLEWSVPSPPPSYSFYAPPVVDSLHPMWRDAPARTIESERVTRARNALTGGPTAFRATFSTDPLTGEPHAIQYLPGPHVMPLLAAMTLLLSALGVLTQKYSLTALGMVLTFYAVSRWLWPDPRTLKLLYQSDLDDVYGLPLLNTGPRAVGWWGAVGALTVIGTGFSALFFSYFYLRIYSEVWPQANLPLPSLLLPAVMFSILGASTGAMHAAQRFFEHRQQKLTALALAGASIMAVAFIALMIYELVRQDFVVQSSAYASIFYVINCAFAFLVVVSGSLLVAALRRILGEFFDFEGVLALQMQITALFWYFTAALGIAVFIVVYVSPYLV